MDYSQLLFRKLLVSCFFAGSLCETISFGLKSGSDSLSGASITLICILDRYTDIISIFKSDDPTSVGSALSKCTETTCRNLNPDYIFTTSGNIVEVTIKSLQRAGDQKWWTCRTTDTNSQRSEKRFYLTVYTVPSSIRLNGPTQTCDLGQRRCEYTCTTDQCTYPSPKFTWLYVFDDNTTGIISHTTSISEKLASCVDETRIYKNTLTFPRYQLFTGNTPKTVSLQCFITFTGISFGKRTSGVSQDVVFAVKVSTVQISHGNDELTGNMFTVVNKEEKLLKCIPGNGNPTPTVQWFIGSSLVSTEALLRFIPENSHHGKQIYCVADNIPYNDNDAVSNKPVLYVKVKIQFAYIEPATDTTLSVIEDIPEQAVCKTSAGRPGATIKWYKNSVLLNDGVSTDIQIADTNLSVTKSTRYIKVLRTDSGWTLSCSASNFEGSEAIRANNSKQLNVLYPPEHMSLSYSGKPIIGPFINVIKGTAGTLTCGASCNPPASVLSWNINQIFGNSLTIDDSIQNGQVVNCTARNVMKSTAGITLNGYASIAKKINIQYGALIERIEVNGNMGSAWEFKQNDSIQIACYVSSNPYSTISLFHGVNLLMEKEQSLVLIYTISSAQCSHTSQYICKAGNGITNVEQPTSKGIQINVRCPPSLAFKTDTSVFAKENTTAVLSLTVIAFPIPTKHIWFKNISNRWEELVNSTYIQTAQASLQFNLTILHVMPEDYGEYKLIVDNTVGDPLHVTFVLQAHDSFSTNTGDGDKDTASKLSAVAGALGTVVVLLVVIVVILVLFIWRNHIGSICLNKENLNYEMTIRTTQSSEDRTYDIVNQSDRVYENSAPQAS